MHVIRQPYGIAALRAVGNKVWDVLSKDGPFVDWTGNEACTMSDAYRSEITLYADSTAADVREVRRRVAEFGDRVRVGGVDRHLDDTVD